MQRGASGLSGLGFGNKLDGSAKTSRLKTGMLTGSYTAAYPSKGLEGLYFCMSVKETGACMGSGVGPQGDLRSSKVDYQQHSRSIGHREEP